VLCFLGSLGDPAGVAALQEVAANRQFFDDERASFFGVTIDPEDQEKWRARESLPGIRFFLDFDGAVSKAYGAIEQEAEAGVGVQVRRFWIILDPTLRVLQIFPFLADGSERTAVFQYLKSLPAPDMFAGQCLQAPILFLPNVFEPEFCRTLIELYEINGGRETGFMQEVDGRTVLKLNPNHKRRRDHTIEDDDIIRATRARFIRRVVPEIEKAYQFRASRMERFIIGCYTAEDGGHFRRHRDNTTKGTAHRRFAVSVNLNDDFDGGEVSFPEYGSRRFKPPPGGAIVFSCSLLHAVSKVTSGRRYAFLPFLYDEAAAKVRADNNRFLDPAIGEYKSAGVE
jgi:predicted 2-oxoglutarate/Fe(II)-dependent dioxygenase YbiX